MKRKLVESNFQPIPAGEQIVRIKEIDESDYAKFDKIIVTIEDAGGRTAKINFNFVTADGEPNDTADFIFTRMARAAMGDETLDEIDSQELVGKFASVEIVHNTGDKGRVFANVKKWIGPGEPFEVKQSKPATRDKASTSGDAAAPKKTAAEILAEMRAKKAAGK